MSSALTVILTPDGSTVGVVGIPEMVPVDGLIARPGGSVPDEMDQFKVPVVPVETKD